MNQRKKVLGQRKITNEGLYDGNLLATTLRNILLLELSFQTLDNLRLMIPFAKPASSDLLETCTLHLIQRHLKKSQFRETVEPKPLLWSMCYQLYNNIPPPEAHKSPHIYCQSKPNIQNIVTLCPYIITALEGESKIPMNGVTSCFLTRQSSCRQHQVIVTFAYTSHSLKDTDLCSWLSNTMYQAEAYTLQLPAAENWSLACLGVR